MKLKSYFSGTVEAAVQLARRELGEEALLVNARPATPETRHLGAYEVVFGLAPSAQAAAVPAPFGAPLAEPGLAKDIADLRHEVERMALSLSFLPANAAAPQFEPAPVQDPHFRETKQRLVEAELEPAHAALVAHGTPLESIFETSPSLGRPGASRAVAALVGPPGSGKTTTLIKLAARYGLARRRPAQILSVDVCRIAAAEQLRALAAILGIGCEILETPAALSQALTAPGGKELILIDTPGFSSAEMEDAWDLAGVFASHPEVDVHLVLPASMKPSDLTRAADRFLLFHPHKLIFTRMDETTRYGALVSEAARRQLPVSFVCGGQQIPDDLEEAASSELAARILNPPCAESPQAEPAAAMGAVA